METGINEAEFFILTFFEGYITLNSMNEEIG